MTWDIKYPIDATATGDTVTEAILKQQKELKRVYDLMNRVRKLDFGKTAPGDPIEGHAWINDKGLLSLWNDSVWVHIGNITGGATFPTSSDILPGHIHLYTDSFLYVWDGTDWKKLGNYNIDNDLLTSTSSLTLDSSFFTDFVVTQFKDFSGLGTIELIDKGKIYGNNNNASIAGGIFLNLQIPDNSLHRLVFSIGNSITGASDITINISDTDIASPVLVPTKYYAVTIDSTKTIITENSGELTALPPYFLYNSNPDAFSSEMMILRCNGKIIFCSNTLNEPATTVPNSICFFVAAVTDRDLIDPVFFSLIAGLDTTLYKTITLERLF